MTHLEPQWPRPVDVVLLVMDSELGDFLSKILKLCIINRDSSCSDVRFRNGLDMQANLVLLGLLNIHDCFNLIYIDRSRIHRAHTHTLRSLQILHIIR